ncbi:hypothetical protein [Streptomyces chisholmiae]|nr:hypothetical protein [Streptomyces sp. DSM 44915]
MEYHHLLAAWAVSHQYADDGSGPPPAVSELEADRRAGRAARTAPAPARARTTSAARWRRRRPATAAPATVT